MDDSIFGTSYSPEEDCQIYCNKTNNLKKVELLSIYGRENYEKTLQKTQDNYEGHLSEEFDLADSLINEEYKPGSSFNSVLNMNLTDKLPKESLTEAPSKEYWQDSIKSACVRNYCELYNE